ncbi:MAG TPA: hypothetical protein PK256_24850 [Verrucomicrobiota bacterium]|nr:hypothetical protein [Verrucomicrobiota bacterium]
MKSSQRPKNLAEVAEGILNGEEAGFLVRDFLHEFQFQGNISMVITPPPRLSGCVENGERYDAFLQALAVTLASRLGEAPPHWTSPCIQLKTPWFATPGLAMRNYLLISSPAPFRMRNLFIDEDSLKVA